MTTVPVSDGTTARTSAETSAHTSARVVAPALAPDRELATQVIVERASETTFQVPRVYRCLLALIALAYLVLATWYALAAPVLEIGDEVWHYQVADHLAAGRGLLVQGETPGEGIGHQQASQPPLYYLWAALTVRAVDPDPEQPRLPWNPWSYAAWPGAGQTANLLLHTTDERFPASGYARATYLLRLQAVLFGLGTVLLVYAIAREVAPRGPVLALTGAAIVAFNPGFLLDNAIVGNDSPAIFLTTLAVWLLCRALHRDGSDRRAWLSFAAFGVAAGLAGLTKVSALSVLAPAALLLIWQARRHHWEARRLVLHGAAVMLPVLALVGWWVVRNLILYGELTGTRRMAQVAGLRQPLRIDEWPGEIAWVWATYWGIRPTALPLGAQFALPAASLALLALGIVAALRFRRPDHDRLPWPAALALWAVLLGGLLLSWTAQTSASYGRLLYPGVAAFSLLMTAGLATLVPAPVFRGLAAAVAGGLLIWAGLFPSRVLAAEFRDVRAIPPARMLDQPLLTPAGAVPIRREPRQRYGDRVVLESVDLNAGWLAPGEPVGLTLTWRALAGSDPLQALVYLLCPDNQVVGHARLPVDLVPGVRLIQPVSLPWAIPTEPSLCAIAVGVDDPAGGPLPVFDESRQPISAKQPAAQVRLAPLRRPVPDLDTTGATDFGGLFRLLGVQPVGRIVRPGETGTLFLFWEDLAPVDEFWTVFVQLVGPDGRIVAQDDGPPAVSGAPTWAWRTGAIVADQRRLEVPADLPPGEYRVLVGFYRPDRPVRLPAANGTDHAVALVESVPEGNR